MINGRRVIAIIPARGGSKGIKNKNIIDVCGKPLIAYTVEAANKSEYVDRVLVTTDSEKIADVAKEYGASVPFLRPADLAGDHSKTIDCVLHAINHMKAQGEDFEICVLLQPTSPLRSKDDIDHALELFAKNAYEPLVAVSEVQDSPILIRSIGEDGVLQNILSRNSTIRRQDMDIYYRVNGSIYICRSDELNSETSFNDFKRYYVMEKSHSVDVDELADLEIVKYYLQNERGAK